MHVCTDIVVHMGADFDSCTHRKMRTHYILTNYFTNECTQTHTHRACPVPGVKSPWSRQLGHMTESSSHRALSCLCGSPAELNRKQFSNAVWQEYSNTHTALYNKTLLTTQWYHSGLCSTLCTLLNERQSHETQSVLSKSIFAICDYVDI